MFKKIFQQYTKDDWIYLIINILRYSILLGKLLVTVMTIKAQNKCPINLEVGSLI